MHRVSTGFDSCRYIFADTDAMHRVSTGVDDQFVKLIITSVRLLICIVDHDGMHSGGQPNLHIIGTTVGP